MTSRTAEKSPAPAPSPPSGWAASGAVDGQTRPQKLGPFLIKVQRRSVAFLKKLRRAVAEGSSPPQSPVADLCGLVRVHGRDTAIFRSFVRVFGSWTPSDSVEREDHSASHQKWRRLGDRRTSRTSTCHLEERGALEAAGMGRNRMGWRAGALSGGCQSLRPSLRCHPRALKLLQAAFP